jgi:hypothetical protein
MRAIVLCASFILTFAAIGPGMAENSIGVKAAESNQAHSKSRDNSAKHSSPTIPSEVNAKTLDCHAAENANTIDCQNLGINQRIAEANVTVAEWTHWLVIVGCIQFAALAFTLFATIRAANAAKKGADVSERALALTERAFLQVTDIRLLPLEAGKPLTFELDAKNWGRTPCTVTQATFEAIFTERVPPHVSAGRPTPIYARVMPAEIATEFLPNSQPLNIADVDSFRSAKSKIIAWGTKDYTDMFGAKHTLGFGVEISVTNTDSDTPEYRSLRLVEPGYNYAD